MQSPLFLRNENLNCTIDLADAPQTWDFKLDIFQRILRQHSPTLIHGMYFDGSYVCTGIVECPGPNSLWSQAAQLLLQLLFTSLNCPGVVRFDFKYLFGLSVVATHGQLGARSRDLSLEPGHAHGRVVR